MIVKLDPEQLRVLVETLRAFTAAVVRLQETLDAHRTAGDGR